MTVLELSNLLKSRMELNPRIAHMPVMVVYHQPGAVGGTPATGVRAGAQGFDWDNGKFLLWTDLTLAKSLYK